MGHINTFSSCGGFPISITIQHQTPTLQGAWFFANIIDSVDRGQCVPWQIWLRTEVSVPEMKKQVKQGKELGHGQEPWYLSSVSILNCVKCWLLCSVVS